MSEEQAPSLRRQIDDKVIDARNEIIVQATNAFLLGRQVALVSLGLTVLGVEQTHALLQQAVKRGEVLESEAQQMLDARRRQLAEGTTANISSRLAALLNQVPGVNIAYQAQSRPAPASHRGGNPGGAACCQRTRPAGGSQPGEHPERVI